MVAQAKGRMSVSIRLALIEKLRQIVSAEPSPLARLFDPVTASRATICDSALEVAEWVCCGGFNKDLIDKWTPEFQQRLHETDRNAFLRGVYATAKFLKAEVAIDAERGVVTIHPPDALDGVDVGEIDAKPMVEPTGPTLH